MVSPPSLDREIVEFVVGGFAIAILLCGFVVQPYFVPSGSMATVLLGLHKDVRCPQCHQSFPIGVDEAEDARSDAVRCPHCGKADLPLAGLPVAGGDQVLVWKGIYSWRPLRRWELVVFVHPQTPRESYVKRAVGLPGETIQIKHGDVYIDGNIAAKSFEQLMAMAIPVGRIGNLERPTHSCLSVIRSRNGKGLQIASADVEGQPVAVRDLVSYNAGGDTWEREAVRDVVASMNIGDAVEIQFHGFPGTPIRLLVEYGQAWLFVAGKSVRGNALPKGSDRRLTFACWDGRLGAFWNGKPIFEEWPLPVAELNRDPAQMVPLLTIDGYDVAPTEFELLRDVYYTERVGGSRGSAVSEPYKLGPREYFMLGDNSDVSRDSRAWDHPSVPIELLVGKPMLVHLPLFAWRIPYLNRVIKLPDFAGIRRLR